MASAFNGRIKFSRMEAPRSGSAVRPCQPEKHTAAVGRSCCISRRDAARRYVTNVAQNGKLGYRTTLPHDRQAHCARVSLHTSPRTHSHDPAPHPAKSTPRASSFRIGRKLPSETVKRRSANPPPQASAHAPVGLRSSRAPLAEALLAAARSPHCTCRTPPSSRTAGPGVVRWHGP